MSIPQCSPLPYTADRQSVYFVSSRTAAGGLLGQYEALVNETVTGQCFQIECTGHTGALSTTVKLSRTNYYGIRWPTLLQTKGLWMFVFTCSFFFLLSLAIQANIQESSESPPDWQANHFSKQQQWDSEHEKTSAVFKIVTFVLSTRGNSSSLSSDDYPCTTFSIILSAIHTKRLRQPCLEYYLTKSVTIRTSTDSSNWTNLCFSMNALHFETTVQGRMTNYHENIHTDPKACFVYVCVFNDSVMLEIIIARRPLPFGC